MNATLKIETQDFTVNNVNFSDYLLDKVSTNPSYVEVKRDLEEIFSAFFHSDDFKEMGDTENFRMLHFSLNQLLDDLFLGICKGRMNYLQEQLDKVDNREKGNPFKS